MAKSTYRDKRKANINPPPPPTTGKGKSIMSKSMLLKKAKKYKKKVSKFVNKVPNNSNKTVNLYNTFGKVEDNIEFNVYDINDNLINRTSYDR